MASQITHIPYGKKVLDQFLSDQNIDEAKFFVGTLFPDIRYLGTINREKTHVNNPTLEQLRNIPGDFEKGMYAHGFIDIKREELLERLGAYDVIQKNSRFTSTAMKFVEDEFSYSLIDDWGKYIEYLNTVFPEELNFVPKNTATKWHTLLKNYFNEKPSQSSVVALANNLRGFNQEIIQLVSDEVDNIKSNPKLMEIIQRTYSELFKENQ